MTTTLSIPGLPNLTGLQTLTLVTALGSGLAGGVLFAFSTFVMSGLDRLPPFQAVAAMQSINVTAVRPAFMLLLFGTAAGSVALIVAALRHRDSPASTLLLAGAGLYLLGVIALTIGYHVPLNDGLARVNPAGAEAATRWSDYVTGWTRWNHVRAVSSLAAATAFTLALLRS